MPHTSLWISFGLWPLARKSCNRPTLCCSSHFDNSNTHHLCCEGHTFVARAAHEENIVSVVKTSDYISVKFPYPSHNTNAENNYCMLLSNQPSYHLLPFISCISHLLPIPYYLTVFQSYWYLFLFFTCHFVTERLFLFYCGTSACSHCHGLLLWCSNCRLISCIWSRVK